MYKIKRYFQGVIKQAKMVRWPKRADMLVSFAVVITIIVFSAIALSVDNFVIAKLLQALEDQFGTTAETTSSAAMRFLSLF